MAKTYIGIFGDLRARAALKRLPDHGPEAAGQTAGDEASGGDDAIDLAARRPMPGATIAAEATAGATSRPDIDALVHAALGLATEDPADRFDFRPGVLREVPVLAEPVRPVPDAPAVPADNPLASDHGLDLPDLDFSVWGTNSDDML